MVTPRWNAETCFTAEGARIGLRSNRADLLAQVLHRLPPRASLTPRLPPGQTFSLWAGSEHRVYRDGRRVFATPDADDAVRYLSSELHFAVARRSEALFLHAGVVGWKGRAIILPATSHGGKTTLVMALMKLGASYYSDEYAVFDAKGSVRTYAKPLSVRRPGGGVEWIDPGREGTVGRRAIPAGLVLFTRYREAGVWRPRTVSPADCMLGLIQNTVMARTRAEQCMRLLGRAATSCLSIRTPRGEAGEVAPRILECADW